LNVSDLDVWSARRAEWAARVRAAMALYEAHDPVLFGPTALQWLQVALTNRLEDWARIHLLIPEQGRHSRREGVALHYSTRPVDRWKTITGLPVLNPVDHWLQLTGATVNELVEVGDGFVRRRRPLLSVDLMLTRLGQLSGAPHIKLARQAMKLVRPGTESIYETRVRLVIKEAGLPEPTVSPAVWCPALASWFHPDMGYPKAKIGVEFDGLVHVGDRRQMDRDVIRRNFFIDAGWQIITVTASQLAHPEGWLRSIETALIIRGETG